MQTYIVLEQEVGQRLQHFLRRRLGDHLSLRQVKRYLDEKRCRVNGVLERVAGRPVEVGMRIDLWLGERLRERLLCVFEDVQFAAYHKPAGMCWDDATIPHQPVHRLDKETSGLLLTGKNPRACRAFEELFRQRDIFKRYLAVVHGRPPQVEGFIENHLGIVGYGGGQPIYGCVSSNEGKLARTRYQLICHRAQRSLLACVPETGRTHQIRVHLAQLGCPVVGDCQYGPDEKTPPKLQRHLLHAHRLVFRHPITGEKIRLEAKPPGEFRL